MATLIFLSNYGSVRRNYSPKIDWSPSSRTASSSTSKPSWDTSKFSENAKRVLYKIMLLSFN